MRTQKEILNKIEEIKDSDFFGFKTSDLIGYLSFNNAKQYLKEGVTGDQWEQKGRDHESIKNEMIDYMDFAWGKANNCRGISAGRTMNHYSIWVWMLGDEINNKFSDLEDYEFYGKDNLVELCEFLSLDSGQRDDGIRSNNEY